MIWQIVITAVISAVVTGAVGVYAGLRLGEMREDEDEEDEEMQEVLEILRDDPRFTSKKA